eukprot:NODE_726_length_4776_cov_0.427106.p2 type:complete len:499 gc:universal NODE_726_length_4776_cov_0.427106:2825-4321(+)
MKAYKKAKIGSAAEKMRPKTAEQHRIGQDLKVDNFPTNLTEVELQTYIYRTLESKDIYDQDNLVQFQDGSYEIINKMPNDFVNLMTFESNSDQAQESISYNSFTSYSRPIQNINYSSIEKESITYLMTSLEYSGMITQGIIHENYQKKANVDKDKKSVKKGNQDENIGFYRLPVATNEVDSNYETNVLSKMVSQNLYQDIISDFRYWNDPSDSYKDSDEGTLLPLWEITPNCPGLLIAAYWYPNKIDKYLTISIPSDALVSTGSIINIVDIKDPSCQNVIKTEKQILQLSFNPRKPNEATVMTRHYLGYTNLSNSKIIWSAKFQNVLLALKMIDDEEISGYCVTNDGILQRWHLSNSTFIMDERCNVSKFNSALSYATFEKSCTRIFTSREAEQAVYDIKTAAFYEFESIHSENIEQCSFNNINPEIFCCFGKDWRISIWSLKICQPLAVLLSNCEITDLKWIPYAPNKFAYLKRDGQVLYNSHRLYFMTYKRAALII